MCVFRLTIIIKLHIDGDMKFGAHRELLSLITVASNTIKIIYVPLGTKKNDVSVSIIPSVMYPMMTNFLILLANFRRIKGFFLPLGPHTYWWNLLDTETYTIPVLV